MDPNDLHLELVSMTIAGAAVLYSAYTNNRKNRENKLSMDDLPDLPFENLFSYLSLEDLIRSRAVSKSWRKRIDNFKVKKLFFSNQPPGFIIKKSLLINALFAHNFIRSLKFDLFFGTFRQSILSNLKHLRLSHLCLNVGDKTSFCSTLNLFDQLEELDMIQFQYCKQLYSKQERSLDLILPMLNSIRLEEVGGIERFTLDAPRLKKIKILDCYVMMKMRLVHTSTVEKLIIDDLGHLQVKELTNLKYLYSGSAFVNRIDSQFLSRLPQLKEIHLDKHDDVLTVFKQKQEHSHSDLKIHLFGVLLNGRDDPAMSSLAHNITDEENFAYLAESSIQDSRLADEIPLCKWLTYSAIELAAPGLEMLVLGRLSDLSGLKIENEVQNIERFVEIIKTFENIYALEFSAGNQPQELFDRFPEKCGVQRLTINCPVADCRFLFRLKNLMGLEVNWSINTDLIRKLCEQLKFISLFAFEYKNQKVQIEIDYNQTGDRPKEFKVSIDGNRKEGLDLNAAIQHITTYVREERTSLFSMIYNDFMANYKEEEWSEEE